MNEPKQLFSANLAKDAVYKPGLRSFMEYRDLGIEKATHGHSGHMSSGSSRMGVACMICTPRVLHKHLCDFQMYLLC